MALGWRWDDVGMALTEYVEGLVEELVEDSLRNWLRGILSLVLLPALVRRPRSFSVSSLLDRRTSDRAFLRWPDHLGKLFVLCLSDVDRFNWSRGLTSMELTLLP